MPLSRRVTNLSPQPLKLYIDRKRAANLLPPIVVQEGEQVCYASEVRGATWALKWSRDNVTKPAIWLEDYSKEGLILDLD